VEDLLRRIRHRESVTGDHRFIADFKSAPRSETRFRYLRDKYTAEDMILNRAAELFAQFRQFGATWAGCVQACRTDFVPQFTEKWGKISAQLKQAA